jgi:hypothetical protein
MKRVALRKWVKDSVGAADGKFKKFLFKDITSIPEEITASDEKKVWRPSFPSAKVDNV